MPTPIITLPIHTIEQARALSGLLRAFIDGQSPDTNDGQDWKPDADYPGIVAAWCHLDAAIKSSEKPAVPLEHRSRAKSTRDFPVDETGAYLGSNGRGQSGHR